MLEERASNKAKQAKAEAGWQLVRFDSTFYFSSIDWV